MSSFGKYRLSAEEQQAQSIKAVTDARIQRIKEVRKQDRVNAQQRNQNYKSAAKEASLLLKKQAQLNWESNLAIYKQILLRQHIHELGSIGTAQINAERAALIEISNKKEESLEQRSNERVKLQRFKDAMKVLKDETKERTLRVRRLVVKRSNEHEIARLRAKQYAKALRKQHRNEQDRCQELHPFRQQSRPHESIDFNFSRAHEHMDLPVAAFKTSPFEQTTASENAKVEQRRTERLLLQKQQKQETANGRARDRGEVALLRERAIIQRQIFEAHLEKEDRSIRKTQQTQVIKNAQSASRSRNNKASIKDSENKIRKILHPEAALPEQSFTLPQRRHRHPTTKKNPVQEEGKHVGIQADFPTSEDMSTESASRNADGVSHTASTQEATVDTIEDRIPTPPIKTVLDAETQTTHKPELEPREDVKQHSVCISRTADEDSIEQKSISLTEDTAILQSLLDFTETESNISSTIHEQFPNNQTNSSRSDDVPSCASNDAGRTFYEDSLSEALSMETDVFMKRYLQPPSDSLSSTSEQSSLGNLSYLLAESEYSDLSMIPEESPAESTGSQDATLSTGFGEVDMNRNHRCSVKTLVKELDKMSEDSVYLLTSLSELLASTTSQQDQGLRYSQRPDSSTTNWGPLCSNSVHENSKNSDSGYSLLLETIREDDDTEHVSLTSSLSLESEDYQSMSHPLSEDTPH